MLERCSQSGGGACHANGCNQCNNGLNLFKRGYSYYCEDCNDIFGAACKFCQDFQGCGQCESGYTLTEDPTSKIKYCKPDNDPDYVPPDCGVPINQTLYPDHIDPSTDDICNSTLAPTPSPTDNPTPSPTENPTPSPTSEPTPAPTNNPSPAPTDIPTPSPTSNPTPSPTDDPTLAPTDNPTPSPTSEPTPSPTDEPTPSPTSNPTPAPTDEPTPAPTNDPTFSPTDNPTPGPTSEPTPQPSPQPTPRPTHDWCSEVDYTLGIRIIISSGCSLTNDECTAVNEFVSDVVEKTYNPEGLVNMELIAHNKNGIRTSYSGTREEMLTSIGSSLECNDFDSGDNDEVNYDAALQEALVDLVNLGDSVSRKKIVMMSFCKPDDDNDDACNTEMELFGTTDNGIEFIVVNAGSNNGGSIDSQYSCLTNGNDDHLFNFDSIDESTLLPGASDVEDEICQYPTQAPTDRPTQSPSDKPTESPTDRPSASPSERPTMSPTDKPSPKPTNLPTLDPTARYCDGFDFDQSINIVFSNGCNIPDDAACADIISFLRNVVERTYNPSQVDSYKIYTHNLGDGPLTGTRDELLSKIDLLTCSEGQETDFDSTIESAMIDLRDNAPVTSDYKKLLIISFCGPEASESDDTCNVPSSVDPDDNSGIEIIIFNADTPTDDQFSCLLPNGINDNNYIYIPSNDGEVLLEFGAPTIEEEICKNSTGSPTESPTPYPTGIPTKKPTDSPTDDPTPGPTRNPTPNPTPGPTANPTPDPTPDPTPGPTSNPTPSPTPNPTRMFIIVQI